MNNSALLSGLLFSTLSFGAPHSYYIIIHGTWSRPFTWHMPGGRFYDSLASVCQPGTVSFFLWSGENNHEARIKASKELVHHIKQFYTPDDQVHIIAHSHGANVGILASQLLAQDPHNEYRIHSFYALATPTHTKSYMPNMHTIGYFYNFFSFSDYVQPVFGLFGREYPEHERIANIFVTINGQEPSHSELHHPVIAQWIPSIHEDLATQGIAGFDQFTFKKPGIIEFTDDSVPKYSIDPDRQAKRERDERILHSILQMEMLKKRSENGFRIFRKGK